MPETPHYGPIPGEEPPPLIRMDQRPAITIKNFRRMRSISLDMAAWIENHCNHDEDLLAKILELREIING